MKNDQPFTEQDLTDCLSESQNLGFISDQELTDQIQHSRNFLKSVPADADRILDLGAGGGLPCLVFLNQFPARNIWALDSMKKRTDFLESVAARYVGISGRLTVINGRAEIVSSKPEYQRSFDAVIARGFGSPQITAECSTQFLKVGGRLLVSGRPENEIERWSNEGLSQLGLRIEEISEYNRTHVAVLYKFSLENPRYPRRTAAMKNSPLW